jgi:hypothetical protein
MIVEEVRAQHNGTTNFVRQVGDNRWKKLGDKEARDKVGHAIREEIKPRVKNKAKSCRRKRSEVNSMVNLQHPTPNRGILNKTDLFKNNETPYNIEDEPKQSDDLQADVVPLPMTPTSLDFSKSLTEMLIQPSFLRISSVLSCSSETRRGILPSTWSTDFHGMQIGAMTQICITIPIYWDPKISRPQIFLRWRRYSQN